IYLCLTDIAGGDEDVMISVVVSVTKQGTPATVGVCDALQTGDFTEYNVPTLRHAVAQLQRVDVVNVAKPSAAQVHATAMREIPAHPLASLQGGRHHVHLHNVGPAVVIEISDIDTHARKARMLEPRAGLIGERAIA